MLRYLVKHSFRSLLKQRSFVFINIAGLSVGLVCSIVIALYIFNELSYDQYHENKDRIYRVTLNGKMGGQEVTVAYTASVIGPTMYQEFPEVESYLRMNPWGETVIRLGDKYFTEDDFLEADSAFFSFFSIPLLRGDPATALSEPNFVVLSQTTAKKIFGDEDPMNKVIKIGNTALDYRVSGIMADVPDNTHFRASAVGSFLTNERADEREWLSNSFHTYVMLKEAGMAESANKRFAPMIEKYIGPLVSQFFGISLEEFFESGNKYNMYLQPLTEIHLSPEVDHGLKAPCDPKYLRIFGSVAILIILIAAVNFMNLSTAQASKRAREIGIKKVCGSSQGKLILQFLAETLILSFLALMLALLITELTLPYFNELFDTSLHIGYIENWTSIPALLLLCLFVGLLAGLYPAFYLSGFHPNHVLKGTSNGKKGNVRLRSILVVLQFAISIVLIIGTLIMYRQLSYMQNKDLGFDQEEVLVIGRAGTLVDEVEQCWDSFTGGVPMHYFFLDQDLKRLYREERQGGKLSVLFTIIGILVASLGLYGLTSFAIAQRTREVGIRKTFGATVSDIWYLFAKETIVLVAIAALIAVPLVWWVADNWLQHYYYRISPGLQDFLFGLFVASGIALLTVSYRIIRTARDNPGRSLRYE